MPRQLEVIAEVTFRVGNPEPKPDAEVQTALWATATVRNMADDIFRPWPGTDLELRPRAPPPATCADMALMLADLIPGTGSAGPRTLSLALNNNGYEFHTALEYEK